MSASEPFSKAEKHELLNSMSIDDKRSSGPVSPKATAPIFHSKHGKTSFSAYDAVKLDIPSHSGTPWGRKKGGAEDRGTRGSLLNTGREACMDRKDPNDECEEEPSTLVTVTAAESIQECKNKLKQIVEEYFLTGNISQATASLRDLASPTYDYYFVKKLISMALDRHDGEKENAAALLSSIHADVIDPQQMLKGYERLVESADSLSTSIPDALEILALFVARAIADGILPRSSLQNIVKSLPEGAKGHDVISLADKLYLSPPFHADIVERRWGRPTRTIDEHMKNKISALLNEYLENKDKIEACRCIRELNVPFFHHEIVERILILVMKNRKLESLLLTLLKEATDEGLITSSEVLKGFTRLAGAIDDLADIVHAREVFAHLVSTAIEDGYLTSPYTIILQCSKPDEDRTKDMVTEMDQISLFKQKVTAIIQEYFLSDDISEVIRSLEELSSPHLNAVFVKRVVTLAMDRKNREKEMASVLLSSLCGKVISSEDVAKSFVNMLETAEDTALDIPDAANELAFFLARTVVDAILVPVHLDEIKEQLKPDSLGTDVVNSARSLLAARHAGERILRCWGGGSGWVMDDVKEKIVRLLEEFEAVGDVTEACRCIREIDMSFFHHEVVKKALVMAMEKQNDNLLDLLHECSDQGLITVDQMTKGFKRVADSIDDLVLDIPNAKEKFMQYVQKAKSYGWFNQDWPM
ncbi:hypothetical protein KP509_37G016200 [Ceratopteris richardii]|uniref:MI domain-containing protein n=1 Tax=Ceratopteris richardii TaxID=49495 RepID=A0A8T2Q6H0_CERRI|nr:hypothetical protein KP509_37G016200 [Ceratopteris richardii]